MLFDLVQQVSPPHASRDVPRRRPFDWQLMEEDCAILDAFLRLRRSISFRIRELPFHDDSFFSEAFE